MTNTTHTPGPWAAEYSDYGEEIWFGGYGAGMWTVEPVGAYLDGASKENARLIAAAPDLLTALETAYNQLATWIDSDAWDADDERALELISAAIAKAKGE